MSRWLEELCPGCRTRVRGPGYRAGQQARCPRCGDRFVWLGTRGRRWGAAWRRLVADNSSYRGELVVNLVFTAVVWVWRVALGILAFILIIAAQAFWSV